MRAQRFQLNGLRPWLHRVVVLNGPHPGTVGLHALRHPTQLLRSWSIGAFQLPLVPELLLQALA